VPSLGGGGMRCKPLIPLTVIGPKGQETCLALLDSGADDIVLPTALAARVGVDLSSAVAGTARGVGSAQPVGLLYAPVILVLTDNVELCRWRAVIGFTQAPLRFPLFGIAGGLEHFQVTLDIGDRQITILPKPTLPATQDPVP